MVIPYIPLPKGGSVKFGLEIGIGIVGLLTLASFPLIASIPSDKPNKNLDHVETTEIDQAVDELAASANAAIEMASAEITDTVEDAVEDIPEAVEETVSEIAENVSSEEPVSVAPDSRVLASIPITVYSGYYGQTANRPFSGYGIDPSLRYRTTPVSTTPQVTEEPVQEEAPQEAPVQEEAAPAQETTPPITQDTQQPSQPTPATTQPTQNSNSSTPEVKKNVKLKVDDVMYEGNGIKITYKGIDMDYIMGPRIKFYIENNSSIDYTVQARDVYVNDYAQEEFMSSDIKAGKKANDTISFLKSYFERDGITKINTLELHYVISEMDSLDSFIHTETYVYTF